MRLSRRDVLHSLAAACAVAGAGRATRADEPTAACPDEVVKRAIETLGRSRRGVTTLSGPFVQERTIGLLAAKVRSTGRLTLVRPDKMRWDLSPPDAVSYWVTAEGLAYRSAEGQGKIPAGSARLAGSLSDLRTVVAGDLGSLRARYAIDAQCRADTVLELRLTPLDPASASFRELRFSVAADGVSPARVVIVEGPRDRTEISFGTLIVNASVDARTMTP